MRTLLLVTAGALVCLGQSITSVPANPGYHAIVQEAKAHVKQVDGQHSILIVVAEDVGVIAFHTRHALFFLHLLDGGDQVSIFGGPFILLTLRGFGPPLASGR